MAARGPAHHVDAARDADERVRAAGLLVPAHLAGSGAAARAELPGGVPHVELPHAPAVQAELLDRLAHARVDRVPVVVEGDDRVRRELWPPGHERADRPLALVGPVDVE